ncbi:hypothetical protein D3C76_1739410 [compost metagenome]
MTGSGIKSSCWGLNAVEQMNTVNAYKNTTTALAEATDLSLPPLLPSTMGNTTRKNSNPNIAINVSVDPLMILGHPASVKGKRYNRLTSLSP